jgi:arsenate reductase-like glutaredoxin family protein
MYTIGFIDNYDDLIENYKTRLKRKDIELLFVENCTTKEDVLHWILSRGIKCMAVDYRLKPHYTFNGTELVAYLNTSLPDLACIILTNYCDEGIEENLVIKNLFFDRDRLDKPLDSPEFEELVSAFKQAIEVFNNRLERNSKEYNELKKKKDAGTITDSEEERFLELYRILRAYSEVDDLPTSIMTREAMKKMTSIIDSLEKLLENKE